ncbi:PREDICTED: uncharacterized protein LOC109593780 [Amphimedon queenslandica]|uniref:Uncharacterized protein n=1 Tax=Amphimedon queenslandica TaxID=400682 RepID=A0A1X7VJE8_AMPQE|nr:PREDICTED: uncharacterized protein LOC109593780 [Amphimedon queenslandica]|eukprot:XP_019864443.1 PREDICTED: uncharacterized protein LOC109593780 [Amphimedon queenslandica]
MATATLPGAPTFGDMIDMLEEAEDCSSVNNSTLSEVLYTLFQMCYPTVVVRPQSLYNAAKRIAAPANSSLRGTSKLSGTALSLYRRKEWLPRIRTTQCTNVAFPSGLVSYGLSEDLLGTVFDQFENHEPLSLSLRGIPVHGFYQNLHPFLKKWPGTQSSTKSSIGKFYSTIDINLNTKSYRPDTAYQFIERLVLSQFLRNSIVKYGLEPNASLQSQVKECMEFNQKVISDLEEMKKQCDEAKRELNITQLTLREALDELKVTAKCKIAAEKKVSSLQSSNRSRLADYNLLKD